MSTEEDKSDNEENKETSEAKSEAEEKSDNPTGGDSANEAEDDTEEQEEEKAIRYALVVEDARVVRRMLVKILSHAGYKCDEAENGYEALALLRKAKSCNYSYNVIATDLMMPEMDGWALIEQLIEKKIIPNIPIVVITASATVETVRRCMKYGIKNFIVKPFQAEKVIETIEKVTGKTAEQPETSAAT